ncbi:MAG: hypothetical protein ACRDTF_15840 [Pseudonocardiaceae bacterium]
MSQSVYQTNHDLLCEVLRRTLRNAVESGPGSGMAPVQYRVCAMAYELLCDHPVDRRGRCRSCRRPGAVFGRARRKCRVYLAANFYLRQPEAFLLPHLVRELPQTPAVPSPTPRAGRPDPEHGGAGKQSARPRPRRAPFDGQIPPNSGAPLLVSGGTV